MKLAYFDCPSGICGSMILGALIDAGLDVKGFKRKLSGLRLPSTGFRFSKVTKKGIAATNFEVVIRAHAYGDQQHRNLNDIVRIINSSRLPSSVKKKSIAIFTRLAKVEAKVHGMSINNIHFHEVGAVDAIIDIVGTCIVLEMLGIEKIYCSPLPMGKGFVKCAHGKLPLPAPATVELLKNIPIYGVDCDKELVTPTGAAIISTLAEGFGKLPEMEISSIGYGAGKRDTEIPNVVRVFIGDGKGVACGASQCILLETNIDDMNPQIYEHIFDKLLKIGAFDVWLDSIVMKKSRPGMKLSVLCKKDDIIKISDIILKETTSIGIRVREIDRITADRKIRTVKTKYGNIRIKTASINGIAVNAAPEYDDCKRAANKYGVPLKQIMACVVEAPHATPLQTKRGNPC